MSLLKLGNEQTKIVPAYGPVMTRAEFKAERDMMEEVRARLFKQVREGDSPKDMLEAGVLNGLARTWKDPYKFLYDAAKGLWAHHNKWTPMSFREALVKRFSLAVLCVAAIAVPALRPGSEGFSCQSHSRGKPQSGARTDSRRRGCE